MSVKLFVYGTLLFEPVWLRLIGRVPSLKKGVVYGWTRKSIKGVSYPAICREDKGSVLVALIIGLTEDEMRIVDAYEDVGYAKTQVEVVLEEGIEMALSYVREDDSCSDLLGDWTPEDYLASGALEIFLARWKV